MANLDEASVVSKVRLDIGNPTVEELADAVIETKIKYAVRRYNSKVSGSSRKLSYFTTVADQQAYTVPAGVDRIVDVFWTGNFYYNATYEFGDDFPVILDQDLVGRDLNFRSLSLISEMKVKQIRDIASFGYDWMIIDRAIYLDPYPTVSGEKVYYFYTSTSSDVATLEDDEEELVVLFASAECLRVLAATRANVGVIDREGAAAYSGARDLRMLADQKMEQFEQMLADRMARGKI